MADPRFFRPRRTFTLGAWRRRAARSCAEPTSGDALFDDVAPLETAGPERRELSRQSQICRAFRSSRAGAAFVDRADCVGEAPPGMALLVASEPYKAYALAAQAFYPARRSRPRPGAVGIDRSRRPVVPEDCDIGAQCRYRRRAPARPALPDRRQQRDRRRCRNRRRLPDRRQCHAQPCADRRARRAPSRGADRPGRVRLCARPRPAPIKVPQLGRVIIGDDVDIGANTTIDRGSGHDTVIGAGSMIDNLVQIGHNVVLGRCCILAGQVGISGSTRLGDFVMIGGQGGLRRPSQHRQRRADRRAKPA